MLMPAQKDSGGAGHLCRLIMQFWVQGCTTNIDTIMNIYAGIEIWEQG
jgi:hypothetical protein